MKPTQTINIACACDLGFLPYTAAMLRSVFVHNQHHKLNIYLIYKDIPEKEIHRFEKMICQNKQTFIPCQLKEDLLNMLPVSQHISIAAYYRLLIPDLVPQDIEKILYLDGDMIVRKDISELWNTPLDEFPLAAVPGLKPVSADNRLGMTPGVAYFNSGVLLMNLPYWRNNHLAQQAFRFIEVNPEKIKWWDQDGLNAVVDGNFVELSTNWNVVSAFFYDENLKQTHPTLVQDPSIVHFTGMGRKPWELSSTHPFKKEYVKYQNRTPWKTSIFNSHLSFLYRLAKKGKNLFFRG